MVDEYNRWHSLVGAAFYIFTIKIIYHEKRNPKRDLL